MAATLLIASCAPDDASDDVPPDAVAIECALAGATQLLPSCTMEEEATEAGRVVVIRHPDGGFRRFGFSKGRYSALDGALEAEVGTVADGVLIAVGEDRYLLPEAGPVDE